jgi:hypothetical protein
MTEKIKTVCVGRYLVDVPAQAETELSGGVLDGFDIDTVEESEKAFRERIAAREAEIRARPADPATNTEAGLREARDLRVPGSVGRTFIYGRSRGYLMEGDRRVDFESVSVESHVHMSGISFTLSMSGGEDSDANRAETLFGRLQVRGKDEIPAVQGFCIDRGIFVEPLPAHKVEHIVLHLGLPGHPDLGLTLASFANANPGPGLLARVAETDASMNPAFLLLITKLRAGKRNINGVDGEEVLLRAREANFTTTYGFNWEAHGTPDDPTQPFMSLELRTGLNERPGGKPVDSSLHEDALLALWNSIASSIRLRKDDLPPQRGAEPPPSGPKLGAMATAGEVCPQSGWWRCNEGGPGMDVYGGQVQYIREGDRMPQALLLPRQTLWQKVKRIQPGVESPRPTVWTLADKRHRPRSMGALPLAPATVPASGQAPAAGDGRAVTVGSYVRTGDVCPASGWWRCVEPKALDATRWFAAGTLLPPATFQLPAGVFAKSAGPELIQRRSGWQLMRHAASPSPVAAEPPALA